MKRTLWYPASIDPARVGYYEVSYWGTMAPEKRYWNGNTWLYHKASVYCLFGEKESDKWRGLAAPQNIGSVASDKIFRDQANKESK